MKCSSYPLPPGFVVLHTIAALSLFQAFEFCFQSRNAVFQRMCCHNVVPHDENKAIIPGLEGAMRNALTLLFVGVG